MDNLPTELLQAICVYLCLHCRQPDNAVVDILLPKLRRSVVGGLQLEDLGKILEQTTVLEDLNFHYDCMIVMGWPLKARKCSSVKNTFRRLVYSIGPQCCQVTSPVLDRSLHLEEDEDWPSISSHLASDLSHEIAPDEELDRLTARMLPQLEFLETEKIALYGPVFQHPDLGYLEETHLVDLLPPNLRILHVGLVVDWEKMRSDLVGLASRANHIVPDLRIVPLDVYEARTAAEVDELVEVLAEVKIDLVVGKVPKCDGPRGILGPRPEHTEVFTVPPVTYPLTLLTKGKRN